MAEGRSLSPHLERVTTALEALKDGIGARAVGLFDDDRGMMYSSSEGTAPGFWDALADLSCLGVDWIEWHRELRTFGRARSVCTCRRGHAVQSLLIHQRWALVAILEPGPLAAAAGAVIAATAKVLAAILSTVRARGEPSGGGGGGTGGGGGPDEARVGIPVWWLRRS